MFDSSRTRWLEWLEDRPRVGQVLAFARSWLPPVNYITIHYAYFISVTAASSLVFWGSAKPFGSVDYVDSLFLVTSALTTTGLATRNLSEMTAWQQVQLWFLLMIGSPIWVSFWTVLVRKRAFERRFEDIVETERERRRRHRELKKINSLEALPEYNQSCRDSVLARRHMLLVLATLDKSFQILTRPMSPPNGNGHGLTTAYSHGSHAAAPGAPNNLIRRGSNATTVASAESENFLMHWKKILGKHNVSRSGQFYDLSEEEREHLGGCEYRALKILSVVVPLYSILFQFLGAVALACWIALRNPEIPRANGQNPWWAGIFYSVSAFNNGGFTLLDDSVVPFQSHYFVLFVIGLLILAGNTAYPIFLRLGLWSTLKLLELTSPPHVHSPWKETFEFILKYPRRVYTTLFPARATWWLVGVLFVTNLIDWVAFEVLNIGNQELENLPVGDKIVAGLFQAISVRAAGFAVISISVLYVGVQVLYLIMMYISVYPVVITMRNSNVYEERSLGIYDDEDEATKEQENLTNTNPLSSGPEPDQKHTLRRRNTAAVLGQQLRRAATFQGVGVARPVKSEEDTSRISFIGQQIRGQLAHDLWWLVLAILIIVIIETDHFLRDPITFSVFNILFEATSAYACVGLSIGLPNDAFSFSGGLHKGSKIVLVLVMLRGRHRGLPVAIDRAVRLPGDQLRKDEEEDTKIRRTKTMHRMMGPDE
ncbi:uncharacterized protein J7T54_000669 [Emericellopsis cladophorae]|uniref:Potassium transport protein n=1 Tax=Emericellopsis cladophorae TaxID=2686198 RepID=A0A9Q0BEQ5_9HYPO|nr:uncharacterized protein J7T54_000669 [Emericellopsis cladophorae]KAI6783167.1 hypothetical protein J7T54_000669 [Emericellopsis cladophorae]